MPELARLNEGVTMEQLNEALSQPDPMAALPLVSLWAVQASVDGQVIYDLRRATMRPCSSCRMGRRRSCRSPRVRPAAQRHLRRMSAVSLVDFNFAMPDKIATGPQVWQIDNAGKQWHEMGIVQLNEGVTVEDLLAMGGAAGP